MKISFLLALGLLATAAFTHPASAASGLWSTEAAAQASCPAEPVVWIQLGGRFYYAKTQDKFAKGSGVYACEKVARSQSFTAAKTAE